ncbi:hypothetical protein V6N11_009863 [Hibiscus sabdariffa]|uniref:Uncharacterized protein n=1 Tax=Hibiscus sabdariffa TaxID=183260 RepID=A0ABR1ZXL3_9ROSI
MSLTSENLGGEFPTLSETHGGRPPEIVAFPPRSATLERQGSPLAIELQPVTKRGKGEFQTRDDFDVCMNVSEEDGQMGDRLNEVHRSAQEQSGGIGSRYAILRDNVEDAQGSMQRSDGCLDQGLDSDTIQDLVGCRRDDEIPVHTAMKMHEGPSVGRGQSRSEQDALVEGMANGEARMELDDHDDIVETDVAPVLGRGVGSTDDIVVSETTLNKEKHTAMRVGDELSGQDNKSRHGRILPASFRGHNNKPLSKPGANFKGGQRLNLKVKQNVDRGNGKPNLASRVSMLMSELDGAKKSGSTSATTSIAQRHGRLVFSCTNAISPSPTPVGTMVDDDGDWDWSRLSPCLPRETLAKIATVPPLRIENIEHALRLCSKAKRVWEILLPPSQLPLFDALSFDDWLLQGVRTVAGIGIGDDLWNTKFAVTCWLIWKSRCAQILGGVEFNSEGLARHCRGAAAEFAAAHACRQVPRAYIQVPW